MSVAVAVRRRIGHRRVIGAVLVLVMLIVHVSVLVFHLLVHMCVLVSLGQM